MKNPNRKKKLSIRLPRDLVAQIDREARRRGEARSAVIESWLRSAARRHVETRLASEVIAYYDALDDSERREDERLIRSLTAAARRVDYRDGTSPTPRPKRRR